MGVRLVEVRPEKTPSHLTITVSGNTPSGRSNDHCGPFVSILGWVHFPGDPSKHFQAIPLFRSIHDIAFHYENSLGVLLAPLLMVSAGLRVFTSHTQSTGAVGRGLNAAMDGTFPAKGRDQDQRLFPLSILFE
jgi:hypothetical protein